MGVTEVGQIRVTQLTLRAQVHLDARRPLSRPQAIQASTTLHTKSHLFISWRLRIEYILGVYRDNGKVNGNYYIMIGYILG